MSRIHLAFTAALAAASLVGCISTEPTPPERPTSGTTLIFDSEPLEPTLESAPDQPTSVGPTKARPPALLPSAEGAARAFLARLSGTWAAQFRGAGAPSLLGVIRPMDPSSGEVPSAHFVIDVAPGEWEEHTWEWDAARKRMAITVRNNRKKAETFPGVVQLDGKTMIGKASPHAIRFSFQGDDALEWFTRGTTGAISLFRAERIDEAGPTAYGPVYFHGASERLTQIGRECLDRTAAAMTAKKKAKSLLLLSGHADPTEPGGELGRRALGDRRAVNARDYLELRGVSARRLLETYSVGDQRPACSESTVPCAVRNRRVEMLLFR